MQDSPPWANWLIRVLRFVGYSTASLAGLGVLIASTPATASLFPRVVSISQGTVLIVFGLLCLVGASLQKWVLEWVSLWFLSSAILVYTVAIWAAVGGQPSRLAGAGALSFLLCFMLIRIVELTAYWVQNVRVAKLKQAVLPDES
jgi:hypothetical protein